jgi:cysteinyl-tRNA synthetase
MDDDFNTPEACSILFEMVGDINKLKSTDSTLAGQLGKLVTKLGGILGILTLSPNEYLRRDESVDLDEVIIDGLIADRNEARKEKNWTRADEIRDQLLEMKVVVEDGDSSSGWRIDRQIE